MFRRLRNHIEDAILDHGIRCFGILMLVAIAAVCSFGVFAVCSAIEALLNPPRWPTPTMAIIGTVMDAASVGLGVFIVGLGMWLAARLWRAGINMIRHGY